MSSPEREKERKLLKQIDEFSAENREQRTENGKQKKVREIVKKQS